jgi:hypothetical protein
MLRAKGSKLASEAVSDWVEVADEAANPRFAIPITSLERRAYGLQRELCRGRDPDRAFSLLRAFVSGAKTMRADQAHRAREGKAVKRAADPDAVSREAILQEWNATNRVMPGRSKKTIDREVMKTLSVSKRRVERARQRH